LWNVTATESSKDVEIADVPPKLRPEQTVAFYESLV
jgi:hypothetical protein